MQIPQFIKKFGLTFFDAGFECYLVGGAIRNIVAKLPVTDFDFATNAQPGEVQKLFKRVIPTGIKHGTVTVLYKNHDMEVTTYRVDGKYSDSRRPDKIVFTPSIFEDLKRRDFTINAMAYNLKTGEILDPHGGRKDLERNTIRAIGDPNERFAEDPLRILRACRFTAQLSFSVEENTKQGMKDNASLIRHVSSERVRDELIKTVTSGSPSSGILMMEETGILDILLPELAACKGVEQRGMHKYDVFNHSLMATEFSAPDLIIRFAALLHDIGKPATLHVDENGNNTFHGHEKISAQMAHNILRRLKFSKAEENDICHLIEHHMFSYDNLESDAAIRRFISRVGKDSLPDLFKLRFADSSGIIGEQHYCPRLSELQDRISDIAATDAAFSLKDLQIDGNILSREAGIPAGPEMGKVLSFLLESVMDDPEMNTKERLVALAKSFYENYITPG